MHIKIVAVGKAKAGPEKDLYTQYATRITKHTRWSMELVDVASKKPLSGDALKDHEAELIVPHLVDRPHVIALEEKGKTLSSLELARHINRQEEMGIQKLAFVIGGAAGLSRFIINQSQLVLSLGRVTWPHLLVRGLLAEQIYRVYTILTGHPYHKE